MLSHRNIVSNTRNCMLNDGFPKVFNEHHSTLLFLPLAHSYAQLIQYGAIYSRTVLGLIDMAHAVAELPAYRPTAVLSVPRVWEKAYNNAKHQAVAGGHGKIFANAEATAIAYSRALDAEHVPIADMGLRRPSLDDVFLSLTGHVAEETRMERAEPSERRRRVRG